uniref:Uncharacterized protein n=1 Tax=Tanacetum cinerariifolium TaxID=118510 RepID=A0A6L2JUT5_TANCI|nr:hypothetical protein [Tanacetum cinerariifolium]
MLNDKESSAAGTDNHPLMLEESDYESWKVRIERYIRGKPLGEGEAQTQVTRDKFDKEFTEVENKRELADIQAANILSQGLLRHIFNILNQTKTGKDIWDNVELLMKVHQRNTKFVNNLPPYWVKYVTNVKNNKGISKVSYVDLYTYLNRYEPHTKKKPSKTLHDLHCLCLPSSSQVPVATVPRAVDLADSHVSMSIDQDASSISIPSTQDQEHSIIISQGFEESPKRPHYHDDPLHESLHDDLTS